MKKTLQFVLLFALLMILQKMPAAQNYISPADLDYLADSGQIVICDQTGNQILFFDVETEKITRTLQLPKTPLGAVCTSNGTTIYLAAGMGPGSVYRVNALSGKIEKEIDCGFGLNSPVLSTDEKQLFVCSRFDNSVKIIDLKKDKVTTSIAVKREPVSAVLSAGGRYLFVSNHLPDGRADVDYVASKMSVVDLEKHNELQTIKLVNGAEGMREVCNSPDGKHIFATHLMARFQVPTTQIERGWINTNALSVVDAETKKLRYTVLLDDLDMGFANPWALKISENGKYLFVSAAGTNEVRVINLPAMTKKIKNKGEASDSVHLNTHNDLTFISGVSKRIKLNEIGIRCMLVVRNKLFVGGYFSESLGIVDFDDEMNVRDYKSVKLANNQLTAERLGEMVFNDATKCFQQWQSCASCHSSDARVDALNWDLLNDGMGNSKNVKSLLFAHQTPPVMSLGVRDKAETAVRAGIKYIEFTVRPQKEEEALDAYLKSLKPVPSPFLVKGNLSKAAKNGKKIFEREGCNHCHSGELFTNLQSYNLGTGKGIDEGKAFDTPTLKEVWRTAPYWHDGRAETISDAIKFHYSNGEYKLNLTAKELDELSEYVLSL